MEDVFIVLIVFGFVTLFFSGIYKLIRAKMDRTGINEETFDRLAKAFIQYKKDTNRRIEHLEAIIADEQPATDNQFENTDPSIEIEEDKQQQPQSGDAGKLRNMLHE